MVNKHLNKALCKICLKTLDGGDPPSYGLDKSSLGDEINNALKFWKHLLKKHSKVHGRKVNDKDLWAGPVPRKHDSLDAVPNEKSKDGQAPSAADDELLITQDSRVQDISKDESDEPLSRLKKSRRSGDASSSEKVPITQVNKNFISTIYFTWR